MASVLTGARADVERVVAAANAQDGCPRRGKELHQRAGELHAKSPADWDGKGNVPPGWSDWRAGISAAPPGDPDGDTDAPAECGTLCDLRIQDLPPGSDRGAIASAMARTTQKDRVDPIVRAADKRV